jgi:hypothetical protein
VNLSIDLTTDSGSIVTNATAWFRLGTNGVFDALSMTNSGLHWSTATSISHPDAGTVQYAVQYFRNDSSPAFFPINGTNSPSSFQVVLPPDYRSENFDTNWPNVPWGAIAPTLYYSNAVNPTTKWEVQNINIAKLAPVPTSGLYRALFPATSTGSSWIASTMLTNVISSVQFKARNASANQVVLLGIESCYETNAVDWVTNAVVTNLTDLSYTSYVVTNLLNPASNQMIRLRKYSSGFGYGLGLDDIIVSYPPASVAISNVFINPGYPSTGDTVRVSCEVTSSNPMFPAYGITPYVYYRRANDVSYTPLPMFRVSGNRYATLDSLSIPTHTRDTEIKYYIRCNFFGYHASTEEDRSPQYSPAGYSSTPLSYIVRSFAGSYSNATSVVNGTPQTARMLADRTWQSVVTLASTTTSFSLSFVGAGYSQGLGYSTSTITWGNSNNWQTTFPLADAAGIGQTNLTISGTFQPGQYVIRFNELTGEYVVQECAWQDFDSWAGTAGKYGKSVNSSLPAVENGFDSWPTNVTHTRTEPFSDAQWTDFYSANFGDGGAGGNDEYAIFGSKIVSQSVLTTNAGAKGTRFVVQASREDDLVVNPQNPYYPLRGIGTISYQYRVVSTNPCTIAAYFYTNTVETSEEYKLPGRWLPSTGIGNSKDSNVTNTGGFVTKTLTVNTNASYDVIFSQDSGNEGIHFDNMSVSEWYSETFASNGWVAQEAWIEQRPFPTVGNCIRLEASRADPFGTDQYVQSPVLTNGINTLSFSYSASDANPVIFDVQISFDTPDNWSNLTATVTNTITSPRTNYVSFSQTIMLDKYDHPYIYLRVKNATPVPGALLLDDFVISPYGGTRDWKLNNCAIDASKQTFPPALRQFYAGACYINSNRVSNTDTNELTRPNTNTYPTITTPVLEHGIGEISFWYRNWTTSGVPRAAELVIQTAATDSSNDADWTQVGIITNIVNTDDYRYFRTSVYEPTSRYVRIYNNDTSTVGRVCVDDILVTTPIAASLSMSNLVTSPSIPLYSNQVDVVVDVYHLFLAPSNLSLTAYYATATNYGGAIAGGGTPRAMTCVASNLSVPGEWYRFQTTADSRIPTNAIDKYVAYSVRATFDGLHSEITSPITNRQFGVYPTWLEPMPEITNNTAFYVAYSCPTGSVWINEINHWDLFEDYSWTNEYVELCGPAGANIKNWSLELWYADQTLAAVYQITNHFILSNSVSAHGFWVLGDQLVKNVDMVFTGRLTEMEAYTMDQNLPYGGGLVLKRSTGAYVDRVNYGLGFNWAGFTDAGYDSDNTSVLAKNGSGTNGSDFGWNLSYQYTPGTNNIGQILYAAGIVQNAPPTIQIMAFWINTNVWVSSSTASNWYPTLWQTTNLLAPDSWTVATNYAVTRPTTTNCTINFPIPTNHTPRFYKVIATNSP